MVSTQVLHTTWPQTNGASSFLLFFFFLLGGSSSSAVPFVADGAGFREERRKDEVALESSLVHEGQVGVVDLGVA